jgi:hypothetical protein
VFWKPKLIEFPNNARRLDKLNLAMEKVDEFLETSTYIYIYIYITFSLFAGKKRIISLYLVPCDAEACLHHFFILFAD